MGLHVSTFGMCIEGYFRARALKRVRELELTFLSCLEILVFKDIVRQRLLCTSIAILSVHHKFSGRELLKEIISALSRDLLSRSTWRA